MASKDLIVAPKTVTFGDTAERASASDHGRGLIQAQTVVSDGPDTMSTHGPQPRRARPDRPRRYMEAVGTLAPVDDGLVSFTQAGHGELGITRPANSDLVPPSYYMLFAVNSKGIPSAGHWARVP